MKREWKPGDVGNVLKRGIQPAFKTERGWTFIDGSSTESTSFERDLRPLIVIDPEDREQVERLDKAIRKAFGSANVTEAIDPTALMQDALREFANPTPPKPEEPKGLGAVVEDANGTRYVRVGVSLAYMHWRSADPNDDTCKKWAAVPAVRVLSEGVTA